MRNGVVLSCLLAMAASSAYAQALIPAHKLPLALAVEAAQAAIDACKKQGWSVTATIVEPSGLTKAVLVGDGAGPPALEISRRKAYTAAMFDQSTDERIKRQLDQIKARTQSNAPSLPPQPNADPYLVLQSGGIPIRVGQEEIGAIGVSGAAMAGVDSGCAQAGLDKIRDRLK